MRRTLCVALMVQRRPWHAPLFHDSDLGTRCSPHEYMFLIDRSSSIQGNGIVTAKEAMKLLLNQLPSTNTMFNIYSFGRICSPQWSGSKRYTDATVHEAVRIK